MADPVTLIVLVAAGEVSSPTSVAMVRATRDALGSAAVELRGTPRSPTDAEALAVAGTSHPDAVVELIWDDADHRKAKLRIRMTRAGRWLERSMTYTGSDPVSERGRTLGLAIASTLPELETHASTPPSSSVTTNTIRASLDPGPRDTPAPAPEAAAPALAAPSPPLSTATPNATAAPRESRDLARAETPEPAPAAPVASVASVEGPSASPSWPRPRFDVELAADGATGIDGSANAGGGNAAAQWFAVRWLGLRLGSAVRYGNLTSAEATVLTVYVEAGLSLRPWQATRARPFDLTLRADYLLVRQSATHFDSDDPRAVTDARWLSGGDVFLDAGWFVSADVAAVAGLGLEDVMAPTYIEVKGARVVTIPALRMVAELGMRLCF